MMLTSFKTRIKECAKKLTHLFLGDYSIYYVYTIAAHDSLPTLPDSSASFSVSAVDESIIRASPDALIQEQLGYAGVGAHAYACFDGERIVGICFYWSGDRYLKRNFWPLKAGEAKLVQIISLPDARGRGVATRLVSASCQQLLGNGYTRVYARIWHSNTPSVRAFERAGWARIALVFEINPLRRSQPLRIRFNLAGKLLKP